MINSLDHRYIARFIVEARTALFVGSGDSSLLNDAVIQRDSFGFPMIPGTAITGVIRHKLSEDSSILTHLDDIFGHAEKDMGKGSRIRISNASMILENGRIIETIEDYASRTTSNIFDLKLENLPIRQHVKITDKGVAGNGSLFDNEVLYKGAQFKFEIELIGSESDQEIWTSILDLICSNNFRVGKGTRNGHGALNIKQRFEKTYNLNNNIDLQDYVEFEHTLNSDLHYVNVEPKNLSKNSINYTLKLKADDFFLFSKGSGDSDVDQIPVTEDILLYNDNMITFKSCTLMPATSIKGALSHRVCYHYNKLNNVFADNMDPSTMILPTGINNKAVNYLFGSELEKSNFKMHQGRVIIDDIYLTNAKNSKIFNHVAIDRFTGGAMEGALFSEKVSSIHEDEVELNVTLVGMAQHPDDKENDIQKDSILALEKALEDICKGLLPLGGMTTKGHGIFTGSLLRNDEELFNYNNPQR